MSNFRSMVAVTFALAFLAASAFAEQMDNPQYKQWAAYKPGTWVTMKTVSDTAGNKMEMQATTKLMEVTAEKAVLEVSQKMKVAGNDMDMPAQKMEVPAKIEKPVTPENTQKPDVKTTEGSEELTVAGQKCKCKTTESTMKMGDTTTVSKTWTCDDVPGTIVKMQSKSEGAAASNMTMEVTGMEIKK